MAIHFVNISREKFLKDYKRIYRFTSLERFLGSLSNSEFTFIDPKKWNDPFEKFFLERNFKIDYKIFNLPARERIFAVCFSGTISSEAYWKVYAPKEDGIRLTFNSEKLLNNFLEKITEVDVYIGKISYQITREFYKISIDKTKLIKEIEDDIIGEQQIKLFLKKRKSFLYEDEIRIIIVPHNKSTKTETYKVPTKITDFIQNYTLDPRLGKNQVKVLKEYFKEHHGFAVSHSNLYNELKTDTIDLTSKKNNDTPPNSLKKTNSISLI